MSDGRALVLSSEDLKKGDAMRKYILYFTLAVSCVLFSSAVAGPTYSFTGITNNNAGDIVIGEAQMSVEVTKPFTNSEQTLFTFRNIGTEASYIADVLFFDGVLLKPLASLVDADETVGGLVGDVGVDFSEGSNQSKNFDSKFNLVSGFSVVGDASFDGSQNGIHPGESLGVLFDLTAGSTYFDVINGLNDGTITIGIKVQGFDSGSSDRFTTTTIPSPGSIVLGAIGISFVGWLRRRCTV